MAFEIDETPKKCNVSNHGIAHNVDCSSVHTVVCTVWSNWPGKLFWCHTATVNQGLNELHPGQNAMDWASYM